MRFELEITPQGRVDAIRVIGGTLDDDGLERCTEQVCMGVEVSALDGGKDANARVVMTCREG